MEEWMRNPERKMMMTRSRLSILDPHAPTFLSIPLNSSYTVRTATRSNVPDASQKR
jgi:hypothetical protein